MFVAGADYKIHAYDEDSGKTHDIAGTLAGSPSMYEVDGREYRVLTVSGPDAPGRGNRLTEPVNYKRASLPSGYVVFSLPLK